MLRRSTRLGASNSLEQPVGKFLRKAKQKAADRTPAEFALSPKADIGTQPRNVRFVARSARMSFFLRTIRLGLCVIDMSKRPFAAQSVRECDLHGIRKT
jgi:hypothetical protein